MGKTLTVETGVVEYTLNDAAVVRFNPTDFSFIERLFNTFDELDKKQDEYVSDIEKAKNNIEVFEITRRLDEEMKSQVDGLLGSGLCAQLLGDVNIYALADGLPIWANLFLALMDEIDTSFAREQKATNPRLQKYLKKYKK